MDGIKLSDEFIKRAAHRLEVADRERAIERDGRERGCKWAGPEGTATARQLKALQESIAYYERDCDHEDPVSHALYCMGSCSGDDVAGDVFFFVFGHRGNPAAVTKFWERAIGPGDMVVGDGPEMRNNPAFVAGFIKGALEVWRRVRAISPTLSRDPIPF